MIRVTIKERGCKTLRAEVTRLDAVIVINNGPAMMHFKRTGPLVYTPMGPVDVSILHAWMGENKINLWDLTLTQVDEAIGK